MTITTRFMTLFEGRTGSSLLGGLLNQNPSIICLGEELAHLRKDGWSAQKEWLDQLYFNTENFQDHRIKDGASAVGCKIKLRDISDPEQLLKYIEANDIKIVHMRRDNFIKQVVSSIRAMDLHKETGNYNLSAKQKDLRPDAYPIPIRKFNATLLWLLDFVHKLDVYIATLKQPPYLLSYEELNNDMLGEVHKLCAVLNAEPHDFVTNLIKVTSDDLREAVSNHDDLARFYSGTQYEDMF